MQYFYFYFFEWGGGCTEAVHGSNFETLFGGSVNFESNSARALRRHKSVEIETSKTDITL